VLAEEDVEHHAVDLVVHAEDRDHADLRARLAEAVDAALPLVVAGGVPRKVVVDDGVEVGLEVDALAQAVGADEHPLGMLGQVLDPVLPLLGREGAGDGGDLDALEGGPEMGGDVVGRVDKPAEDDRLVAVLDELFRDGDELLELEVGLAGEFLSVAGEVFQAGGGGGLVVVDVGPGGAVEELDRLVFTLVEDRLPADLVDRLGIGLVTRSVGGGGRFGPLAEGGGGSGGARGHRPQEG